MQLPFNLNNFLNKMQQRSKQAGQYEEEMYDRMRARGIDMDSAGIDNPRDSYTPGSRDHRRVNPGQYENYDMMEARREREFLANEAERRTLDQHNRQGQPTPQEIGEARAQAAINDPQRRLNYLNSTETERNRAIDEYVPYEEPSAEQLAEWDRQWEEENNRRQPEPAPQPAPQPQPEPQPEPAPQPQPEPQPEPAPQLQPEPVERTHNIDANIVNNQSTPPAPQVRPGAVGGTADPPSYDNRWGTEHYTKDNDPLIQQQNQHAADFEERMRQQEEAFEAAGGVEGSRERRQARIDAKPEWKPGPDPNNTPDWYDTTIPLGRVHPDRRHLFTHVGFGKKSNFGQFSPQFPMAKSHLASSVIDEVRAGTLSPHSATSFMQSIGQQTPGNQPWFTVGDVTRAALGAGAGAFTGSLVGKGLSFFLGLTPKGRKNIRNIGMGLGALINTGKLGV